MASLWGIGLPLVGAAAAALARFAPRRGSLGAPVANDPSRSVILRIEVAPDAFGAVDVVARAEAELVAADVLVAPTFEASADPAESELVDLTVSIGNVQEVDTQTEPEVGPVAADAAGVLADRDGADVVDPIAADLPEAAAEPEASAEPRRARFWWPLARRRRVQDVAPTEAIALAEPEPVVEEASPAVGIDPDVVTGRRDVLVLLTHRLATLSAQEAAAEQRGRLEALAVGRARLVAALSARRAALQAAEARETCAVDVVDDHVAIAAPTLADACNTLEMTAPCEETTTVTAAAVAVALPTPCVERATEPEAEVEAQGMEAPAAPRRPWWMFWKRAERFEGPTLVDRLADDDEAQALPAEAPLWTPALIERPTDAVPALIRAGDYQSVPGPLATQDELDAYHRREAERAEFERTREEARVSWLRELGAPPDLPTDRRVRLVDRLGVAGEEQYATILRAAYHAEEPSVQRAVLRAIAVGRYEAARDVVLLAAADPAVELRVAAFEALGRIGAGDDAQRGLLDANETVAALAATALAASRGVDATLELIAATCGEGRAAFLGALLG